MSSGQVFLALGAIILFSFTALNVNRTYISALEEAILIQSELDAVQYGQTLSEEVSSNRANYATLETIYANLGDVSNSATRRVFVTPALDTLYATIQVAAEAETLYDVMGKIVTVTVFSRQETGDFRMRATYSVPIIQPD